MRKVKIILIALLLAMVVSVGLFNQPAQAVTTYKFTVDNRSSQDVKVYLTANEFYEFDVDAGDKETKEVKKDTYEVTYRACGTDFDMEVKVVEDYKLVLYPCENQPTKFQVKSHLAEDVTLELTGYKDYEVEIKPGKTRVKVFSGVMSYEYEACEGQVFAGEISVAKNGTTQLILHSCEWYLHPARTYGQPNPVKFRIVNHASFPVIMTLIGPENYLVTANAGINVYTLVSGSYRYSYYQDNNLITGSMVVTRNGVGTLVITPSYVIGFVDDTGDLE